LNWTDTEQRLVGSGPVVVFYLVAIADGVIRRNERRTFVDQWGPMLVNMKIFDDPSDQALFDCLLESSYLNLVDKQDIPTVG